MADSIVDKFVSGVHNVLDAENIPKDASQRSMNWKTEDGTISLVGGKTLVGAEGTQGAVQGEIFGYKVNGDKVHWRKVGTKIQYFDGTTWQDVVTGLGATNEYTFTNYSSLAGNFTFAFGLDGIYKMHNANPTSFITLYNASKNFKFRGAFIDKGRTIAWGRTEDRTGLYGSYIDAQNSTVYTTVTGEATTSLTGTLAFKGGGATRNCFGVAITITASGQVFTDNFDGTLTGSLGGTGTINYITGAYTLSASGVGTAVYQWEDSNLKGVTDFTKSATRLAGEGFILRQDEGGDAILTVELGIDGAYYSLKRQSAYRLVIDSTDTNPTNNVFRREIGIQSEKGSTSTQKGVIFINTANPEKPTCTLLQQNPIGGEVEPFELFQHFRFQDYTYDKCVMDTYGRYVLVSCQDTGAVENDTTLLLDVLGNKVDIISYGASTFAKDGTFLYMGSPLTQSVYQLFTGIDDDGGIIENFWEGKDEMYSSESLKKFRRLRLKGLIDPEQSYGVHVAYDGDDFALVGTVLGSGSYVDFTSPQTVGSNIVGTEVVGGATGDIAYPYFVELKLKVPKFRKRTIKFVALGYGYCGIDLIMDRDILAFENRIPKRFRQKQNVSLNGEDTDMPNPVF